MRRVGAGDVEAVGAVLAAAMQDDPIYRHYCPDDGLRGRWLRSVMADTLALLAPDGHVYATEDGDAAIGLAPPGTYPAPLRRTFPVALRAILRPCAERPPLSTLLAAARAFREVEAAHPREPHWSIAIAGVRPDAQGRGLGRRLVEHAAALADASSLPCYLETTNPKNVGFYERFGFRVERRLLPAGGAPPVWTMLRPPPPVA